MQSETKRQRERKRGRERRGGRRRGGRGRERFLFSQLCEKQCIFITARHMYVMVHMCFSSDKKERQISSLTCSLSFSVCLFTCLSGPAYLFWVLFCHSLFICLHPFSAPLSLALFFSLVMSFWHLSFCCFLWFICVSTSVYPALSFPFLPSAPLLLPSLLSLDHTQTHTHTHTHLLKQTQSYFKFYQNGSEIPLICLLLKMKWGEESLLLPSVVPGEVLWGPGDLWSGLVWQLWCLLFGESHSTAGSGPSCRRSQRSLPVTGSRYIWGIFSCGWDALSLRSNTSYLYSVLYSQGTN